MKSLNFPLQSGSALCSGLLALGDGIVGLHIYSAQLSFQKILTLWPKGFFSSLSFFSFLLHPWNGLNLDFKESAVLFLPLTSLENQRWGAGIQTVSLKMKILPHGGFRELRPASLTRSIRSRDGRIILLIALGYSSHRKDGSWHGSDLKSVVLFFPPQRLHSGKRFHSLCQWSCH